jgi:hypothetical protein
LYYHASAQDHISTSSFKAASTLVATITSATSATEISDAGILATAEAATLPST